MLADPTRATDDDGTGAPTWVLSTIAFEPLNFTGIDRFGRVWKLQIQGEAKGACHLTLSVVYDDGVSTGAPLTESWDFDVDPCESLKYEFLPKVEPIQNLSLFLFTSFEGDSRGNRSRWKPWGS